MPQPEKEKTKSLAQKKLKFPKGIPECGSDALRFGMLNLQHIGKDINLDLNVLIALRQFCNKIWQSYKLCFMKLGENYKFNKSDINYKNLSLIDQWALHRLNKTIKDVNYNLDNYLYSEATESFRTFWIGTLCDVYLEYVK